jgi:hypothetical protein
MITAAIRRGLLATFPPGTPLAIVAPDGAFEEAVAARNDPATAIYARAADVPAASPNVIVEGLDAVADPHALLAVLRATTPKARLFALVPNGAHLPALAAYFAGAAIAPAHALVRADLEPLMAAARWNAFAVEPIADDLPLALGTLTFALADAATRERVAPAAFLAIADPV